MATSQRKPIHAKRALNATKEKCTWSMTTTKKNLLIRAMSADINTQFNNQ